MTEWETHAESSNHAMTHNATIKQYTFSRKSVKETSTKEYSRKQDPITRENFALKVFEVMKPFTGPKRVTLNKEYEDIVDDNGSASEGSKRCCVKNVHELLTLGLSERFIEEMDYIVSGLEALSSCKPNAVRRRNHFLEELVGKLQAHKRSPTQDSSFRSSGLIQRIAKSLESLFPGQLAEELDCQKANYCLIFLLYSICFEVRRIDHFISPSFIWNIVYSTLTGPMTRLSLVLKLRFPLDIDSTQDLAIWLLAKFFLARETCSSSERTAFKLSDSDIFWIVSTLSQVETKCSATRGRILYILANLVADGFRDKSLVQLLLEDIIKQGELTAALSILISMTGPDEGSLLVAEDEQLANQSIELLTLLEGLEENGKLCTITYLTNLADRSAKFRRLLRQSRLKLLAGLIDDTNVIFSLYCKTLVGICIHDVDSEELGKTLDDLGISRSSILESFNKMKNHLLSVNMLTANIENQLSCFARFFHE